jgi:hypothetical protein
LLTKINFSKFFVCKDIFLRLVRIPNKEKILSVSICDPTIPKICQAKNPIVGNIASCFCHHWKGHFMSLTSNWKYQLAIKKSTIFKQTHLIYYVCQLACMIFNQRMRNGTLPFDYYPILQKTTIPLVTCNLLSGKLFNLMLQEKFKIGWRLKASTWSTIGGQREHGSIHICNL